MNNFLQYAIKIIAIVLALMGAKAGFGTENSCEARSGTQLNPVVELYTSEGCSSCPPADRWLSGLKSARDRGGAVVQAFHVGYWDYIGWADRFATPSHTQRQRHIAARNGQRSIYTPQVVRHGQDWRDWSSALDVGAAARASLVVRRTGADTFEAVVTPRDPQARWSAYWTVTEDGHSTRVKAGENDGETLRHDHVVRQYTPVGDYQGSRVLMFSSVARDPTHPRRVNLVVTEPGGGATLQALGLGC